MIDAGTTDNSTSLNRSLLRGHDLLHNLGGVLTRFCMRRYYRSLWTTFSKCLTKF